MSEEEFASRRRQFILAAIATAAGLPAAVRFSGAGADSDLLKRVLQALGQGGENAATTATIEARLARIVRANVPSASAGALKQRIRANIQADYRAGAIRVVDGWWLSETEAECLELIASLASRVELRS